MSTTVAFVAIVSASGFCSHQVLLEQGPQRRERSVECCVCKITTTHGMLTRFSVFHRLVVGAVRSWTTLDVSSDLTAPPLVSGSRGNARGQTLTWRCTGQCVKTQVASTLPQPESHASSLTHIFCASNSHGQGYQAVHRWSHSTTLWLSSPFQF